jgi:hypothetical protein
MKTLMVALLAFFALTLAATAAAPSRDCLSQVQAAKVSHLGTGRSVRGAVGSRVARRISRSSRLPVLVRSHGLLAQHYQERSESRPRRWSGAVPTWRRWGSTCPQASPSSGKSRAG